MHCVTTRNRCYAAEKETGRRDGSPAIMRTESIAFQLRSRAVTRDIEAAKMKLRLNQRSSLWKK
jgi:hypothetical protein